MKKLLALVALLFVGSVLAGETVAVPSPSREGPRIFANLEYLAMWGSDAPKKFPMVATFSDSRVNNALGAPGTVGDADTKFLYGTKSIDYGVQHGARFNFGGWVTEERKWGAEATGWFLADQSERQTFNNATTPLGLAYYDATTGVAANAVEKSWPPLDSVAYQRDYRKAIREDLSITMRDESQLWGMEALGIYSVWRDRDGWCLHVKAGYQTVTLDTTWKMDTSYVRDVSGVGIAMVDTRDKVGADTTFHGLKLAARFCYKYDRFLLDIEPAIGLGVAKMRVQTSGAMSWADPDNAVFAADSGSTNYGIYTSATNIGHKSKSSFAIVPAIMIRPGIQITKNVEFRMGYNLLYMNKVVQAGDQLDRRINTTYSNLLPACKNAVASSTPLLPAKKLVDDDYLAHGISAGFRFKF